MSDLKDRFDQLGLSQYLDAFVAEGFDTWEIVADISEADLTALNVKLGHRRKLQRAITEWRNQSGTAPLPTARRRASPDGSHRSDESGTEGRISRGRDGAAAMAPQSTKRKYRRHPKPDEHAPERPPSAYVIFSNQVRESLKGQDLSFADIAKIVGERWQVLSPVSRETCDKQAAAAKEKYYQELAEYKKTPQYSQYQVYLAEFKAKYNATPAGREEGKRSKVEIENAISNAQIAASRIEKLPRVAGRREGVGNNPGHRRDGSTDYFDQSAQPARFSQLPEVSPATRPFTSVNSPRVQDQYSPISMSPASTSAYRESPYLPVHGHEPRDRPPGLAQNSSAYSPPTVSPVSANAPYDTAYDPSYGLRHPRRDAPELRRADSSVPSVPSLAHTETSMSSLSQLSRQGSTASGSTLPPTPLPPLDGSKSNRTLPQPILAQGPISGPIEPLSAGLPTRLASPPPPSSAERSSGLSALLMATEMVGDGNRNLAPNDRPP